MVIVTIAKIVAANKAIIEPLPVPNSEDKYNPPITETKPNNWVYIRHDLKLVPICCAVAAGVTNRAVTSSAQIT